MWGRQVVALAIAAEADSLTLFRRCKCSRPLGLLATELVNLSRVVVDSAVRAAVAALLPTVRGLKPGGLHPIARASLPFISQTVHIYRRGQLHTSDTQLSLHPCDGLSPIRYPAATTTQ